MDNPFTVFISDGRRGLARRLPEPHSEETGLTKAEATRMLFFCRMSETHNLAWMVCPAAEPGIIAINEGPFWQDPKNLTPKDREWLKKELREDAAMLKAARKLERAEESLQKYKEQFKKHRAFPEEEGTLSHFNRYVAGDK